MGFLYDIFVDDILCLGYEWISDKHFLGIICMGVERAGDQKFAVESHLCQRIKKEKKKSEAKINFS